MTMGKLRLTQVKLSEAEEASVSTPLGGWLSSASHHQGEMLPPECAGLKLGKLSRPSWR